MEREKRILLAIDTATRRGCVAVVELTRGEGRLLVAKRYEATTDHAERLLSAIAEAVGGAGWAPKDVGVVAAGIGPGSFTGARVALATAKGFAIAARAAVIGVGSLEAMAAAYAGRGIRVPVLDAHRGEVFLAAYDENGVTLVAPCHVRAQDAERIVSDLGDTAVVLGEASVLLGETKLSLSRHDTTDLPSPEGLAAVATKRALARDFDDAATLEPAYVRAPDAVPLDAATPSR